MTQLSDALKWRKVPVGASASVGTVDVAIGEVGTGAPAALITAGVHGDEGPWGAWAIHKLLQQTSPDDLIGTIRVVPNANPLAMEADARNAPLDVLDLNRTFPGNPDGSHTERLAHLLVEHALKDINVAIDLHGGGSWCVNSFVFQMPGGEALAKAFGAPFAVNAPDRSVTLTGYARSQGVTVAALEMGGRSYLEETWADRIASGLRRALVVAGVLKPNDDAPATESIPVGTSTVLRPPQGGIFIPKVTVDQVGTIVEKDTELGTLLEAGTHRHLWTFKAPFDQTAIMLLRPMIARIEGGAMTYVVAEPMQ
ncbi:MAG: M14 family metallopeptidase [Aggregatilineales bacterium]